LFPDWFGHKGQATAYYTGRITSEVLTKAVRGGFPIVISRSSASAMAVAMSKQAGIDIITLREGRAIQLFFSRRGKDDLMLTAKGRLTR
jgi:formate dehydrogenase assembly factor FdhD